MKLRLSSHPRRGFTLLELLVVVSIIAVLAAMLFPAIQRLRETANRVKCINNLHQIGLAMSSHFTTQQCFPMNGEVIGNTSTSKFGLTSFPGSPLKYTYMWGMGNPQLGPKSQTGSWAYAILSYMEETNAFATPFDPFNQSNSGYSQAMMMFVCPSRGRAAPQFNPGSDAFWGPKTWTFNQNWAQPPATIASTQLLNLNWAKTDYAGNYLMMPNVNPPDLRRFSDRPPAPVPPLLGGAANYPITPSDITDGASNTILVGEKAVAIGAYDTGGWVWDEPIFAGGSGGTSRGVPPFYSPAWLAANTTNGPDSNEFVPFYNDPCPLSFGYLPFYYPSFLIPDNDPANDGLAIAGHMRSANNWGSAHFGGVNFLFADGSVRTFQYNVDRVLFQGLLTPAGNHDATPPES
jgi:prepilin-type N-terminal cleavage/methylation domain-containing protein/prepilin-type processing-associated H-X9-DG protein